MEEENQMDKELAKINSSHGVTVKDVPAGDFIKAFAAFLKKSGKFKVPEWAIYYKTACFKDLGPYDPDWLYVRAAAIARQLYVRKATGITSLRDHFGGKQRNGVSRNHHRRSAAKCIRYCFQQLSKMELIGTVQIKGDDEELISTEGRQITNKGIRDMDRIARQIKGN